LGKLCVRLAGIYHNDLYDHNDHNGFSEMASVAVSFVVIVVVVVVVVSGAGKPVQKVMRMTMLCGHVAFVFDAF